ncbi:glycosyltransferase family 4 protein [Microbacterium sp. 18062]|uniref:glycosyltransferase family 4 protein n=1 Tax=Microbacterium sp. 18062 TaxID=2681410 RepID=UPI00135B8E7E|nr:glycosyltransferase [Microbacterium sp. 18062]
MTTSSVAIAYDCLFPCTTGGGERLYRSYAERMRERGRVVDYLTARQWEDAPRETSFTVRAVAGRLRLYDDEGVRRTPAALAFAWGLFRTLVRSRTHYDAVIASGLPVLNVFAARAALLGSGTALVVDYLEVWGRRQWREYAGTATGTVAWLLQRVAIALTPVATCHSQLTARQLRAEGFRGKLLVSPGLIEDASAATFSAACASPPYVLYAGRHIPDKRIEALPAAVAAARAEIPGLRLVILGSGPSTEQIIEAVARVQGESWTDLPGFVSEERLDELMHGAACLANPSRREGYGLVVVESSAHGTPVVLVQDDGNASTELVSPGENGFIAESTNPVDLADALVRAVRGGEDLRTRTRAWYEDAVRTRTVDKTVDGILSALDSAAASARRSRNETQQQGHT